MIIKCYHDILWLERGAKILFIKMFTQNTNAKEFLLIFFYTMIISQNA
jgi:hypothetical protein